MVVAGKPQSLCVWLSQVGEDHGDYCWDPDFATDRTAGSVRMAGGPPSLTRTACGAPPMPRSASSARCAISAAKSRPGRGRPSDANRPQHGAGRGRAHRALDEAQPREYPHLLAVDRELEPEVELVQGLHPGQAGELEAALDAALMAAAPLGLPARGRTGNITPKGYRLTVACSCGDTFHRCVASQEAAEDLAALARRNYEGTWTIRETTVARAGRRNRASRP
jgi:hypothetical protein